MKTHKEKVKAANKMLSNKSKAAGRTAFTSYEWEAQCKQRRDSITKKHEASHARAVARKEAQTGKKPSTVAQIKAWNANRKKVAEKKAQAERHARKVARKNKNIL